MTAAAVGDIAVIDDQSVVVLSTPRTQRASSRALVVPLTNAAVDGDPWAVPTEVGWARVAFLATVATSRLSGAQGSLSSVEYRAVRVRVARFTAA